MASISEDTGEETPLQVRLCSIQKKEKKERKAVALAEP